MNVADACAHAEREVGEAMAELDALPGGFREGGRAAVPILRRLAEAMQVETQPDARPFVDGYRDAAEALTELLPQAAAHADAIRRLEREDAAMSARIEAAGETFGECIESNPACLELSQVLGTGVTALDSVEATNAYIERLEAVELGPEDDGLATTRAQYVDDIRALRDGMEAGRTMPALEAQINEHAAQIGWPSAAASEACAVE